MSQTAFAGGDEVDAISREADPGAAVRQSRGDAAIAAAAGDLPADSKFINKFAGTDGRTITPFDTQAQLAASGLDPVDGATFYKTRFGFFRQATSARLYAGAALGGTSRIFLPGGGSTVQTFNGATYARFIAFHEAGHAGGILGSGFFGMNGPQANAFALGRLGISP